MSENTKLWDILGRTDPAHVKKFKRAGGFEGTAIKPMWSFRRMTEEFGPCGIGWGVWKPEFQVVPGHNNEVLVYCTAAVWYRQGDEEIQAVFGVGGDKVVTHIKANQQYNRPERWESDDEAFKKAYTDAITNALKLIGVGADVHMGLFDDSKYVQSMKEEFAEEPVAPTKSSAALKREGSWEAILSELREDFVDCHSTASLANLRGVYREKARSQGWTRAWLEALANEFDQQEDAIKKVELAGAI